MLFCNFQSIYKAKGDKQSFNELIRSRERPRQMTVVDELHPLSLGFNLGDVIEQLDQLDQLEQLDRSGAMHRSIESRVSLSNRQVFPPPSVGECRSSLCASLSAEYCDCIGCMECNCDALL